MLRPSTISSPSAQTGTPLEQALGQNQAAKDTVEQSAAELFVINNVLKQELPEGVQTGDVAEALEKTDAMETRIQATTEDLAEVNQVLAKEIGEREKLERELAKTREQLARAKGGPSAS